MQRLEFYPRVVKKLFASESRHQCFTEQTKRRPKTEETGKARMWHHRLINVLSTQMWVRINFTSDSLSSETKRSTNSIGLHSTPRSSLLLVFFHYDTRNANIYTRFKENKISFSFSFLSWTLQPSLVLYLVFILFTFACFMLSVQIVYIWRRRIIPNLEKKTQRNPPPKKTVCHQNFACVIDVCILTSFNEMRP